MKRLSLGIASLVVVLAAGAALPLEAQQGRFELTPMIGYRLNGSVNETDVAQYSSLKFSDTPTYGVAFTWNTSRATSVEVTYDYSKYDVTAVARPSAIAGDRTISISQHDILFDGLYMFNTGNPNFKPFFMGGLGASILVPSGNLSSVTNFAFTLGGGFKYYTSEKFGFRGDIRWLPTYLYSTNGGTWCDPFYGCYYYPNDHILHQWDFKLGFTFRF